MINYDIQLKVAATQMEPVWYDAPATITKMIGFIKEASENGAKLVAFGECLVPGYFYHTFIDPVFEGWMKYDLKLMQNSLELDGPEMKRLMKAARDYNIYVVTGYVERDGGSRYMSEVIIDDQGKILLNRRKFKPTHVERTICGEGSGADFKVVETPIGILGTTMCWEHTQPLITYAMGSMHEQIHVSAWPGIHWVSDDYLMECCDSCLTFSRVYAMQTQTYTIVASSVIGEAAKEFFCGDDADKRATLNHGGGIAQIISPGGTYLCDPIPEDQEGIVYADIDLNNILMTKSFLDPYGQYSRPDIFCLNINKDPKPKTIVRNEIEGDKKVDAVNASFEEAME